MGSGQTLRAGAARIAWAVLICACSPGPDAAAPADALRVNLETEPPSLDWNRATDSTSVQVIEQLMRGLTTLGPGLEPVPALAAAWEAREDGRVWRFHLRDDVLWSDGVPLRARHFVDSWRRLLDPATGAEYAYYLYPVRGAREVNRGEAAPSTLGVRAPGPLELEVELEAPLSFFPALLSFMVTYPVRLDVIDRHADLWTEPGNLVSLGPYLLEEWRHEYRLTLRANPRYHGPPARTPRVIAYMISERATQLLLFEQGRLDWVRLPPLEIRRWKDRPEFRSTPVLRLTYYGFNTKEPPFDDVRVRRAFARAIDRSVFPALLRGGQRPWACWIPPGMPAANPDIGLRFDPAAARAGLEAAGIDPAALGPIAIGYNSEGENKLIAEAVQELWSRELGVTVELHPREWKTYLKQLQLRPPPVFRLGWGADYADPNTFMEVLTSYSENNHTGWKSGDYDALIERAAREEEPQVRRRLYDEAQRLLCETDAAIVPLFASAESYAVSERVRGFELNALDLWSLEKVWLE